MGKNKLPDILTSEDVQKFLKVFNKRTVNGYRNYLIVKFFLYTGLRASELINLKVKELNFMTGQVRVKNGKGGKDRIVYVPGEFLKELEKMIEQNQQSFDDFLFINRDRGPIQDQYLRRMVKSYAKKGGIQKDVHPHLLRHTALTEIFKESKNIRLVQEVAGHSSLNNTMLYTHVHNEEIQNVLTKRTITYSHSIDKKPPQTLTRK